MHDKRRQKSDGFYGFERLSQCEGSRSGRLGDLDQEYVSVSTKTYFTLTCPGFLGMIHPIGLSQNPHCHARDRAVGFLEEIF